MGESIKQRTGARQTHVLADDMRKLLDAALADLGALRTQVVNLVTDVTELRLKLNSAVTTLTSHVHGGVTAGAANTSAIAAITAPNAVTASNPAALTLES